jgi:cysteine desulfurase
MKRIYLDNNATTMASPATAQAMSKYHTSFYGNPSSLHSYGLEILPDLRIALDNIYAAINASPEDDVIITSGAAEANNHVLKSVFLHHLNSNKNHIITSNIEHPTITRTLEYLETLGAEVTYLPVNKHGLLVPEQVEKCITNKTILVTVMLANNEIGSIFPLKEIAEIAHRQAGVLIHTDATQGIGKIKVDVQDLGVDYLSFSSHKFHGPKGVGGLFMKKGRELTPFIHGGEQMGKLRAGTLNVPGIVGTGIAIKEAVENLKFENTEVKRLRDKLQNFILKNIKNCYLNGHSEKRTPNTLNISFKGIEGEAMLWDLNQHGIAASTGSACSSSELEASHVLQAISDDKSLSHTAIRFSLSRFNTEEEIDYVIEVLPGIINRLREISQEGN